MRSVVSRLTPVCGFRYVLMAKRRLIPTTNEQPASPSNKKRLNTYRWFSSLIFKCTMVRTLPSLAHLQSKFFFSYRFLVLSAFFVLHSRKKKHTGICNAKKAKYPCDVVRSLRAFSTVLAHSAIQFSALLSLAPLPPFGKPVNCFRAIALHPTNTGLWVLAASWEYTENLNMNQARGMTKRGPTKEPSLRSRLAEEEVRSENLTGETKKILIHS